jgi:hypothetical protein
VSGTRHNSHGAGDWYIGDEPLWEHVRADGLTVQLWNGTPDHRPYDFLVYRFGSWIVLVPCSDSTDREALRIWAESLHGEQAPDGLLVLRSTPLLVVNPWRNQHAATIRMSGDEIVVDIRTSPELCDPSTGWEGDRGAGDGTVQWCIHQPGGIYVYANGYTPAAERFLQDLVEGLEVRRVRPPG